MLWCRELNIVAMAMSARTRLGNGVVVHTLKVQIEMPAVMIGTHTQICMNAHMYTSISTHTSTPTPSFKAFQESLGPHLCHQGVGTLNQRGVQGSHAPHHSSVPALKHHAHNDTLHAKNQHVGVAPV